MNEHEYQPARVSETPDWRRLEVASHRFGKYIAGGIAKALTDKTEIDDATARCIAHVLGRAYGSESALAGFGRSGDGGYESLRDEYLLLYNADQATPEAKELINWLGTYLVERENTGSGRRFMNGQLPPKLEQLLVSTSLSIGGARFIVHLPAAYDSSAIDELIETLIELRLPEDDALQAFLALPDVNVMSGDIMGSFDEAFVGSWNHIEDAVRELAEVGSVEDDLRTLTDVHGLPEEAVTIDYQVIEEQVREVYDVVEKGWRVHVFTK